jgi:3-hydroxyethyl bacteriochlorophyllide a dehydrogenase
MRSSAIVFTAPRCTGLAEIELPEPGAEDLVVRTTVSGVSVGTERWALLGRRSEMRFPLVPGYLGVGVVERGTAEFPAGERVFFTNARLTEPYASHSWMSTHLARAIVAPTSARDWPPYVCKVPAAVDDISAVMTGMAAVAVQGADMLRVTPSDRAVVLGLGVIGQCAAQVLRARGARVTGADLDPARVELARAHSCGAAVPLAPGPLAPQLAGVMPDGGFDIVVDTTSAASVLQNLDEVLRPRGQILLQGYYPGLTPLNLDRLHGKRPTIVVACSLDLKAHECALRLLLGGQLQLRPLVTRVARPAHAAEVYAQILERPGEFLGIVFDWTSLSGT